MSKSIVSRVVLLLCAAGVLSAGQAERPGWKGAVTTEAGVKVVKNPAEPLFGEIACRVQMFDKDGAFVRTIGRQGQGPAGGDGSPGRPA